MILKSGLEVIQGQSEVTPFDKSHISSYWHSVVTMALSYIIFEIKRDIGRK